MTPAPTYAPLLVLTLAQIVTRWNLTEAELSDLMAMLANHERTLMNGKRAYFVTDVERVMEIIRSRAAAAPRGAQPDARRDADEPRDLAPDAGRAALLRLGCGDGG